MSYSFIEQDFEPLKIFRESEPAMIYTLGVDTATGLGDDYSCVQVLTNSIPFEQVAVFRAKWPVSQFSKFVNDLGRYYNEALNVCEVNYPGNSVQDALLQYYRYPRNYQSETHLDEDIDISSKFGYRTTEGSKWLLIREMQLALAQKEIIINDVVTLDEFRNFVYQASKRNSKRSTGAGAGFSDDSVMALMLAYHGAKLYPIIRPEGEVKKRVESQDPDVRSSWRLFNQQIRSSRKKVIL